MSANQNNDIVNNTQDLKHNIGVEKLDEIKDDISNQNLSLIDSRIHLTIDEDSTLPTSERNRRAIEKLNHISQNINILNQRVVSPPQVIPLQIEEFNECTGDELEKYINSIDWSKRIRNVLKNSTIDVDRVLARFEKSESGKATDKPLENIVEYASTNNNTHTIENIAQYKSTCKWMEWVTSLKGGARTTYADLHSEELLQEFTHNMGQSMEDLLKEVDVDDVLSENIDDNVFVENTTTQLGSKKNDKVAVFNSENTKKSIEQGAKEKATNPYYEKAEHCHDPKNMGNA
ncbi:uncharacterized protein LOC119683127 [Teleopsis dalmanni]|uniref:uncharacterized protein LOC119683127 n=1 Tax=Teleopsis dalmanni TaxID=139649 RepID=UPI0018CEED96|nr:uncharacterized protein LOC119683127 [Teleopsis dalmanni]